jgi:hypothetical protein
MLIILYFLAAPAEDTKNPVGQIAVRGRELVRNSSIPPRMDAPACILIKTVEFYHALWKSVN